MNIIKNLSIFLLFLIIGLLIFLYPIIFINPSMMPSDLGDPRFINYILEHAYLYLKGVGIHSSFWDLPIFYPNKNVLAYSDIMLGGMIIYVPIRFFVNNPQTVLQIWFTIVCILNYLSAYILFKKALNFNTLNSAFGAFLFAFCLARYAQIGHLQLMTQFISMFSLFFFFSLRKKNTKLKNSMLFLAGSLCFVLQVYTSFYLGWYVAFAALLGIIILMCTKNTRKLVIDFILYFKIEIISSAILSLILLIPLIRHYLAVGHQFAFVTLWIFNIKNLFLSQSAIDDFIFSNNTDYFCETFAGIGYFSIIAIIAGYFVLKKERKFLLLFSIIPILLFSVEPLYYFVYKVIPGASAIRTASRVIFMLLPVFCYIIIDLLSKIKNKYLVFTIILLITLEQIPYTHNFEWSKEIHQKRIDSYDKIDDCKSVYYIVNKNEINENNWDSWISTTLDIIWVATRDNVYLINGWSGYVPELTPQNDTCIIELDE